MLRTDAPKTIYLKDYKPYPFEIIDLNLNFDIHDGYTIVTATSRFKRTNPAAKEIFLNGEELEILSIKINDKETKEYTVTAESIRIACPADDLMLEIKTKIHPESNTRLEGLYNSGGTYCTQCEAEGFRRITYYPDRPDVLTTFTVRIEADKKYPVLLSNGNRTDGGEIDENRHFTIWEDPHPKPCYLFALVAGDLNHIHDTFITASGTEVDLYIYMRSGDEEQCTHAMDSLKRSMRWDEKVYGLEYDLEIFNIVAVSDFNMGAMENKSLNIFNTALVLAHQETATDQDFMRVESVIAHEYFHNWSGNRVTCRDWFQLSLKEGLTVFRDQEFSADTHSRDVQRIDDVTHLRKFQFAEDAGPLAHPIRPDNYIEINNFYTMTIYEKGAEVIRMMRTILGVENYRKGTDLYFKRHDGQAVTCEDFIRAMEDASGHDLTQFRLWYEQAGTPMVTFNGKYDSAKKTYTLYFRQTLLDTPGQSQKKPMTIPVAIGLLDEKGDDMIESRVLILTQEEQAFVIENIIKTPTASILRGFSAPVKLETDLTEKDLAFLMVNDTDGFNRWECGQKYALKTINKIIDGENAYENYIKSYGQLVGQALEKNADKAFMARALSIPDVTYIGQSHHQCDPEKIHIARENLYAKIMDKYGDKIEQIYNDNKTSEHFDITAVAMGQRALKNKALGMLYYGKSAEFAQRALRQYEGANNMTDRVAALSALGNTEEPQRKIAFDDFFSRYKNYPLVIDKWFALQAMAVRKDIMGDLEFLKNHCDFNIKNPNRVRSLYAAFAMNNPVSFHADNGAGYAFLKNAVIELNAINPQIGARLLTPMREWRRYTTDRQEMMKNALAEILEIKDIAPDIYEIASKSING